MAGMATMAERGIRWFDTEPEAAERALRQAGLVGLVDELADGVVEEEGRWRVAQDLAEAGRRAEEADTPTQ